MTGRAVRIEAGVSRPEPVVVEIDGIAVEAYPGESLASAILASGSQRLRDDRKGAPRGMFCNMGTCSECTVWVRQGQRPWRRRRACLVPIERGLVARTREPEAS